MLADEIRVEYDTLETIAGRFGQWAEANADLLSRVNRSVQALEDGGWEGRGREAFLNEMKDEIFPAMQRLTGALETARSVTLAAKALIEQAEEEAANFFQQSVPGELFQAGDTAVRQTPITAFGLYSPLAISVGGDASLPNSRWLTAPFAAGASLFGPVPTPIFGPYGRVPGGITGAGSRLWLYAGGKGTDTIFSIHPHAGWGRAPKGLPRPELRFDYGVLPNRPLPKPNAVLPNGQQLRLSHTENYFHWNQKGTHSLYNNIRNHQLLTNNPRPSGNILGRTGGAALVRGASRGLLVVGAGMDIYSVATADNKVEEGIRRVSAWGGAWAGAKGGATLGGTIGSFIAPGPGTAIGAGIGGVAGGIGGYFGGYEIADTVMGWFD